MGREGGKAWSQRCCGLGESSRYVGKDDGWSLHIARPTAPPRDLIAMRRPLVMAMRAGGVLSWAIVTRHVKLKPSPRPTMIG